MSTDTGWPSTNPRLQEPDTRTLSIEMCFDLVCPWCLIGKRHLASALARLRELRPDVTVLQAWRGVELLPETPAEGLPYQAFYERRLGGPHNVAARRMQVQLAGYAAGLVFAFDRIEVLPNTAAAHRLIAQLAPRHDAAAIGAFIDRLLVAYFMEGADIGSAAVLQRIAAACGLTVAGPGQRDELVPRACGPLERAGRMQVANGVPAFIFNGEQVLSGAHAPGILLEAMLKTLGDTSTTLR